MRKPKPHEREADPEPPASFLAALVALWLFLAPLLWLVSLAMRKPPS